MANSPGSVSDLDVEEIETILKALGYYQVHLFDQLSNKDADRPSLETSVKHTTNAIKKIHKIYEKMKNDPRP